MCGGAWGTCCQRFFHLRGEQALAILMKCSCIRVGVTGKSYRRQGVPTVVMAPERLCDDYNVTGVRMVVGWAIGIDHGEILTLIFPNSSMALTPC